MMRQAEESRKAVLRNLPRKVYLFGFSKNKPIFDSYAKHEYDSTELDLVINDPIAIAKPKVFWPDFINSTDKEFKIRAAYKDSSHKLYKLLVDAIARETKLKNGDAPIAMQDKNKIYYATYDNMLILPKCFCK